MINRFAAAALSLCVLAGSAVAQTATPQPVAPADAAPAATAEDCLKVAYDLAQNAEDKNLPEAQMTKVEEMLAQMENHCDSKQFGEAASVGTDLKSLIETK